ncbi:hypothetical protein ACE102_47755 (plasmid) [Bradyrhizobium sp. vgs-9]|uniref:hypothetical protein n=1 Tax=Bradyrhizobium sp. vgs-9 TaxID=208389 RepID=UPI0035D3E67F
MNDDLDSLLSGQGGAVSETETNEVQQQEESWPRLFGQRPAGFKWIPAGLC